ISNGRQTKSDSRKEKAQVSAQVGADYYWATGRTKIASQILIIKW
ncbi:hypothetical protein AC249_AIPGENE3319, partial [Exaiptasia diaphana]